MSSPGINAGVSRAGLNGFFNLMNIMGATPAEMATLLAVSDRTVRRYQDEGRTTDLEHDTLERISHILSIWLNLMGVFRTEQDAARWLKAENAALVNAPRGIACLPATSAILLTSATIFRRLSPRDVAVA